MTQTEQKPGLDATLINAVISATTDVLGTMAYSEVHFKEVKADTDYKPSGDISAVIGIFGENGEGMITLSFPLELASLLISRLLGVLPQSLNSDDRCDGVGELVNMVSGNVKAILSRENQTLYKLSLPTVIQGAGHEISNRPKGVPYLIVTFEVDGREFHLSACFKTT